MQNNSGKGRISKKGVNQTLRAEEKNMSKPISKIEETLSVAYVTAVIGITGNSINIISEDYGTDISIRRIDDFGNKKIDTGPIIDCQLKSTFNWTEDSDNIIYDMDADAYNKIIFQNSKSSTPTYLVLLCLPKERENWISLTVHELALRKCCYYMFISGDFTKNSDGVRVKIPKSNIFNPENIRQIIREEG